MSISSISSSKILKKTEELYQNNKHKTGCTPFIHRNVNARAGYFCALISSPIASSLDLILGCLCAVGAVLLTATGVHSLNQRAFKMTKGAEGLFSNIFIATLKFFRPGAAGKIQKNEEKNGIIANLVSKKLAKWAENLTFKENFFEKHIASRILFFTSALAFVALRIIDLLIGVFALIGTLLTAGAFKNLNNAAYNGLKVTLLFNDIYIAFLGTLSPSATLDFLPKDKAHISHSPPLTHSGIRPENGSLSASLIRDQTNIHSPNRGQNNSFRNGQYSSI